MCSGRLIKAEPSSENSRTQSSFLQRRHPPASASPNQIHQNGVHSFRPRHRRCPPRPRHQRRRSLQETTLQRQHLRQTIQHHHRLRNHQPSHVVGLRIRRRDMQRLVLTTGLQLKIFIDQLPITPLNHQRLIRR